MVCQGVTCVLANSLLLLGLLKQDVNYAQNFYAYSKHTCVIADLVSEQVLGSSSFCQAYRNLTRPGLLHFLLPLYTRSCCPLRSLQCREVEQDLCEAREQTSGAQSERRQVDQISASSWQGHASMLQNCTLHLSWLGASRLNDAVLRIHAMTGQHQYLRNS